jgi:hypothetical protein
VLKIIEKFAFNISSLKRLYFGYNNFHFDKSGSKSRCDLYNVFKHLPRLQLLDSLMETEMIEHYLINPAFSISERSYCLDATRYRI